MRSDRQDLVADALRRRDRRSTVRRDIRARGYSPASVVPAALLLPSSFGRDFGSNGPLWSLAFEAVYYAIYPAWLRLRRRSWAAAFVAVPALCLLLAFSPVTAFPIAVLMYYPIWLVGAWLAERLVGVGVHFPFLALLSAYVIDTFGGRPLHGWLAAAGAIMSVGAGCACFEACERHFLHSRYRDASAAP